MGNYVVVVDTMCMAHNTRDKLRELVYVRGECLHALSIPIHLGSRGFSFLHLPVISHG